MVLSFPEYQALKAHLAAEGLSPIHMVDACGGQYFTLEQPDERTLQALRDYFAPMGAKPDFTDENTHFVLLDVKEG